MAAYKVLLAEIYPGHAITSALLWTEEARLMEIPEQMLMPYVRGHLVWTHRKETGFTGI